MIEEEDHAFADVDEEADGAAASVHTQLVYGSSMNKEGSERRKQE
jgi:hypothetical protein